MLYVSITYVDTLLEYVHIFTEELGERTTLCTSIYTFIVRVVKLPSERFTTVKEQFLVLRGRPLQSDELCAVCRRHRRRCAQSNDVQRPELNYFS